MKDFEQHQLIEIVKDSVVFMSSDHNKQKNVEINIM